MSNQINVSIKTPCSENFNNFSQTKKGGYCGSCNKEVIDFTHMNAQEILQYFQNTTTSNTCGRLRSNQLTTYSNTELRRKKFGFMGGIAFSIITLFSFTKTQAQHIKNQTKNPDKNPSKFQDLAHEKNITVKGVVAENGAPLPGANVVLEGTVVGTTTDFDGNFEFPEKLKKGDVLVFSYLGFISKKVTIEDTNSASNVALEVNLDADSCVLMGEIAIEKVYSSKKQ